jgi:hypothetical protein
MVVERMFYTSETSEGVIWREHQREREWERERERERIEENIETEKIKGF